MGPQGPAGQPGTTRAFAVFAATDYPYTGLGSGPFGQLVTTVDLTLQPGTYIIQAKAEVADTAPVFNGLTYACYLFTRSIPLPGSPPVLLDSPPPSSGILDQAQVADTATSPTITPPIYGSVNLLATAVVSAPTLVSVYCARGIGSVNSAAIFWETLLVQARIVALAVDVLQ
jgi:hypothetical protein